MSLKHEIKQLGFPILILLLATIPLDFIVGLVLDRDPKPAFERNVSLREREPNEDRVLIPPERNLNDYPHLSPEGYRLRTDQNGFIRGPEPPAERADVVFIGASTTECLYVDEDKRFPYLVGTMLLTRPDGGAVNTVNAGFTGSHTLHTLITLIAKVVPLRPEMVVVMLNGNDLQLLANTGSYWEGPQSREFFTMNAVQNRWAGSFDYRFSSALRSILAALYPNILREVDAQLLKLTATRQDRDEWGAYREARQSQNFPAMESDFRAAMESIIAVAQAWGIEVVLMTEFNRIRMDDPRILQDFESRAGENLYERYVRRYSRFNEITRELAAQYELTLIDLDTRVPPEERYVYDPLHLTNDGSQLVADIVAAKLAEDFDYRLVEAR